MTKQIAVRLPEELVDFVDRLVAGGVARSRAAVVTRALDRERRMQGGRTDADILARCEPDADLDALAAYAQSVPLGID